MTRIRICYADDPDALELSVNHYIEHIEAEHYGVKGITYLVDNHLYSAMIIYGNGPVTTTRWTGKGDAS